VNLPDKLKIDPVGEALLPLGYLLLVLTLDFVTPKTVLAPLFGIVGLLVFAYCLTPAWMTFWSSVYAVVVTVLFISPSVYFLFNKEAPVSDFLTPYVRSGTFIAGAALSAFLCAALSRARAMNDDFRDMLEKLTLPVITSNNDGRIVFVNRAAMEALGWEGDRDRAISYFDALSPKGVQGELIASYLRRFNPGNAGELPPLNLECRGRRCLGYTRMMASKSPRLLLTMLDFVGDTISEKRA
jgi:PAS domain-containing protein